jgi:hypothetical protein
MVQISSLYFKPAFARKPSLAWPNATLATLASLFVLFTLYGPTFSFAGQWRYVEVVVLVLGLFSYDKFQPRVDGLEWKLCALFIVTAVVQAFSNYINDAPTEFTIARVGTYLILAALVPILAVMVNRDHRRLMAIMLGYCLSYVFALYAGSINNDNYSELPWRLGLGTAATLALVIVFAIYPFMRRWTVLLLLLLSFVHLYLESRSLAAATVLLAVFAVANTVWPRVFPAKFRYSSLLGVLGGIGVLAALGLQSFVWLADARLLPDSMIEKNQMQASNSYGFFAAARPDTITAMYAITKKPILGFGSGVFDPDVFAFYADVKSASYQDVHISRNVYRHTLKQDWSLGIPSHSHVFGAWADAGVFAAISWIYVLLLVLTVLVRVWRWDHPFALLFAFVGIMTVWDVLFSPGPVRLDMALRLIVVATAFRYFAAYDIYQHRNQLVRQAYPR